ncbi:MAG: PAS domain-containing protein [Methylobacterium mesophilicum]|nr:PAS domain-containing protein [Methylobacterium mesophilicum]
MTKSTQPPADPASPSFIPVCAIGASAGGVGALQTLFRLLPDDLGLAYVVVVHLSPEHPSAMHDILSACTKMPVHQVKDGPQLEANCVYVIAPDRELVIDGNNVQSRAFTDPRGKRAPIDMFFRSIAAGRGDGIAVVLTGAGSDGALGVRAIKEAGGIVMVQEPAEAGFPSMPQNAIATGVADVVAPLARLAERIAEAARSKEAVRSLDEDGAANDIRRIVAFLRTRTGHDFSGYKRSTVLRRIQRRMQVCQIAELADYLQHLRAAPEESKELLSDLLISVTMFFRDPETFIALSHRVIRPLLESRSAGDTEGEIRAWVVGCATGEEAYSLAILLLEESDKLKVNLPIQIFATDLDEGALATAREGRYPRSIEADVSAERLKRFFVDEGTHYRIDRQVRDLVLFAAHSVVREPPFMRLDLITCRNVLIYLERALQNHVSSIFRYGLKPDGFLFLGTAETADTSDNHFAVVDRDARIYRALPTRPDYVPVLAVPAPWSASRPALTESRLTTARLDAGEVLGTSHAAALEASAPPSVLVDAEQGVLHLSPTAGRFILLSAGPLSGRLPSIVRPELRLDLKLALDRAFDAQQPTITRPIDVVMDGETRRVLLHVTPLPAAEGVAPRALVFFLDSGPGRSDGAEEPAPPHDELQHLHSELKVAQEAELAGRIRHESAVQELRASNEELQSLNEEYRSTAEELETSKEELQSINEELQTVNAELKSKLGVISAAHNDLKNLTASSEIGTLFLDLELHIRMFTPPVAELINVTEADVGRSITNFTHRMEYDDIAADVHRVSRDLSPIEKEVRTDDDRWFMVRIRPYQTMDGKVEGAVATFDDVTARKKSEAALFSSMERFRALAMTAGNTIYHMSPDWRLMYRLDSDTLASTPEPIEDWVEKYIPAEDLPAVRVAIDAAIHTKSMFELEHRVRQADGSIGWVLSRAMPLLDPDGEIAEWFGAGNDVTERRRALEQLRKSEEQFRALVTAGTYSIYRMSPDWQLMYQLDSQTLANTSAPIEDWVEKYILDEDLPAVRAAIENAIQTKSLFELEHRVRLADGGVGWVISRAVPLLGVDGEITEWFGAGGDVTARREAEKRLSEANDRYRADLEAQVRERTAELQESRDLLQATMDSSTDMIQVFEAVRSPSGEIVDFRWILNNRTSESYYGEVRGESLLEHNPGVIREGIFDAFRRVTETGEPEQAEHHYAHEQFDGWFFQSVVKLGDGVATTTKEISDWKTTQAEVLRLQDEVAQAKLQELEERLHQFGEASSDVLWIRDAETLSWEYLTPAFEAIYGLSREEALSGNNFRNWAELILPEDRDRALGMIQRTREGERVSFEYRIQRPVDGRIRWMRNTDFPIYDGEGRVVRIGGIGHDITDLKEAAGALSAAEQRQRALVEGIPQLVWRAVDGGEWTWASPQWVEYTGKTEAESHGWGWLDPLHPDDRDKARGAWSHAEEDGGFQVDYRILHAGDGHYRWFHTRATPVRNEHGEILEWLGTSTDVDDLRQLQERQAVLVAELQHRIKNLMGVVRAVGEQTLRTSADLADFTPRFRDRMGALTRVQNLLSRLSGEDRITFGELIRTEIEALGPVAKEKGRVSLKGPGGVLLRSSTVQTFALALHELATNAVKYGALKEDHGEIGGRLSVEWRLGREAGQPWLYVDWRERGVAMPSKDSPAQGGGAGRQLIERALPYQLGARTTYVMEDDGVHCTIALAVSEKSAGKAIDGV